GKPGVGHGSALLRHGGGTRVSVRASATSVAAPADGAPAPRVPAPAAGSAGRTRPTVVIVGAGFGGLRAARALGDAPVDVVLVDRHNYHLFQPLLYQVATAGLEPEQIARPVRAVLRRQRNFEFRMTEVTGLDARGKRVVTTDGAIAYDYLILAVGGETNYFGLEGVVRHGFGLKDIPEAIRIRNHVLHAFERAMLEPDPERRRAWLTFVVVGGGPTGVEMAGALSELIRLVLVKDYPRLNVKDVRVLLLEATDRLLGPMPARLREAAAETLWRKKHVEVRFGATVADYDGERVLLKSGEVIPAQSLIWAAGVQAVSLTARLRVHRLPGLGGVAGGAHHSTDRVPQQAVRAAQLGVGLFLLRARGPADHVDGLICGNAATRVALVPRPHRAVARPEGQPSHVESQCPAPDLRPMRDAPLLSEQSHEPPRAPRCRARIGGRLHRSVRGVAPPSQRTSRIRPEPGRRHRPRHAGWKLHHATRAEQRRPGCGHERSRRRAGAPLRVGRRYDARAPPPPRPPAGVPVSGNRRRRAGDQQHGPNR